MKRRRLEEILAERLRQISEYDGIALSRWADLAGIARSYLWLLLDAKSSATLEMVQRLADVVKRDPIELLTPHVVLEAAYVADRAPSDVSAHISSNPIRRPAKKPAVKRSRKVGR